MDDTAPGWFWNEARRAALARAVRAWLGTPWAANSDVPGRTGGVSCHLLPRALYRESGALPPEFAVPMGDPNRTRHGGDSMMVSWLNSRSEFMQVNGIENAKPGDLMGLRLYRSVDHLAVALEGGWFVHVLRHQRTTLDRRQDPTWGRRMVHVWRLRNDTGV